MEVENLEDIWKKYANSYFLFTPNFQEELLKKVGSNLSGRILDAGCGVGKLVSKIQNYSSYVGLDSNSAMIEVAKDKLADKSLISFEIGDVTSINYPDNYFDSVSSINVLYSLNNPLKFLSEVNRVLKPNGKFILASPNKLLDIGILEKKLIEEFGSVLDENLRREFKIYLEINNKLAKGISQVKYEPKLFDEKEINEIIFKTGFKVIKNEPAYFGQLFNITSTKI